MFVYIILIGSVYKHRKRKKHNITKYRPKQQVSLLNEAEYLMCAGAT